MDEIRFGHARVGGLDFHYAEAGPADAPPVMLLHGFPEYWAGWRHQIPALVGAGFRTGSSVRAGPGPSARTPPIGCITRSRPRSTPR